MKTLIRLEELAFVLFSIYLFARLPYAWWVFPLFFFAPDLSLLGNLAGKRIGAYTYNLIHHKGLALGVYVVGGLLNLPVIMLVGLVLFGHSSFDRLLGLGLLDPSLQAAPERAASPPIPTAPQSGV